MMKDNRDVKRRTLFEYIGSYHELLAIIGFCISCAVGTVGYFATKSEVREVQTTSEREVQRLQCFLRLNIEWLPANSYGR